MSGETVAPGFYGKLPVRGDFVSRRLQTSFVAPWDGWLQQGLAAARQKLSGDWLDCYLGSPVWRYVLAHGSCGPDLVAGVMIPSVDRVGRYFPLTVATTAVEALTQPLDLLRSAEAWFQSAEEAILSALDPELDLEAFDTRVGDLGQPAVMTTAGPSPDPGPAENWCVPIADVTATEVGLANIRASLLREQLFDATLWWTRGSARIQPCLLICHGLPKPLQFPAMLAGAWPEFNWRNQDGIAPTPEADPIEEDRSR